MLQSRKSGETGSRQEKNDDRRVGFFGRVAGKIGNNRLGDLLVDGGLISAEELHVGLEEQRRTGEQLGKVLMRQGALSAVQLARQLAEQWCLRAAVVGVTLAMQVAAPASARAEQANPAGTASAEVSAQFRMASAALPGRSWARAEEAPRPELFGRHEVRSDDLSSFGKWSAMIGRFAAPLHSNAAASPGVAAWRREIESLKGLPQHEQIRRVNDFLNRIPYVDDRSRYGENGYWGASPARFFGGGGDCKDYAIAKYVSLRALGFSTEQLRIAVVRDKLKNIAHAILIVNEYTQTYVLDNQDRNIELIADVHRYQPIFSINSTSWWLQRA